MNKELIDQGTNEHRNKQKDNRCDERGKERKKPFLEEYIHADHFKIEVKQWMDERMNGYL